jgi:hypothetical protein
MTGPRLVSSAACLLVAYGSQNLSSDEFKARMSYLVGDLVGSDSMISQ